MAASQRQQIWNGPPPWDVAPDDWHYFIRFGAAGILTAAILVVVIRLVVRDIGTMRAIGFGLVGLAFGLAYLWTHSVLAWRDLNRERMRWGMPTRSAATLALVTVPMVVIMLAFMGFSLREPGVWWSSDNLIETIPSLLGTFGGLAVISLFRRRRALESPANRAMLDREWYRLHGVDETGRPIDR